MSVTINATNLIAGSLMLSGMLAQGESADSATNSYAFDLLNQMIDGLGTQRQTMLARVRTVYSLVANQSTYTFGPSGDFNDPRPITVEGCGLVLNSSTPALEISLTPLSDDQYQAIGIKALTSTLPTEFWYSSSINSSGQGSLFLWPTPTVNTNDLAVYVPIAVTQFSDLTTSTTLAPMYAKFLRFALARELVIGIKPVNPDVERIYQECESWLKAVNTHISDLSIDPALAVTSLNMSTYNVLNDQGNSGSN